MRINNKKKFLLTRQNLSGGRISNLLKLLWINNFHIDLVYLPRMLFAIAMNISLIPVQFLESLLYRKKIENFNLEKDPVFIIGHWRSGTTFLHYLMSQDRNFGFVSNWDAFSPANNFLGDKLLKPIGRAMLPKKRVQDNIELDMDFPQEEEFAMCNLSVHSLCHGWEFPKRMDYYYEKYLTSENLSKIEMNEFCNTYSYIIKKIAFKYKGKQILLKNPLSTTRIKFLLEMYPNAKFVYLYRNPYETYLSTKRLLKTVLGVYSYQHYTEEQIEKVVLETYPKMLDVYFKEKKLIPEGNLCEISYEELTSNPLNTVQNIYSSLSISSYEKARPCFESFIASKSKYEKHKYDLDKDVKEKVDRLWMATYSKHKSLALDSGAV